jgi:radical SAM superfamily enzyme YgiQ (UPF0313 family)
MSSLGFQTVHRLLAELPELCIERFFLPETGESLLSFESARSVHEFALIAVSLAWENELIGLMSCLQAAGIAPWAAERAPDSPPILLGGPITYANPLAFAPFCDVMLMGEAEGLLERMLHAQLEAPDKATWLARIGDWDGVYVPALHGECLRPLNCAPDTALPARSLIYSPYAEFADMHLVELARGCSRRCAFCVMRRQTGRSMRVLSAERVLAAADVELERVGLVGAAVSDHPQLLEVLEALLARGQHCSLSSVRADRVSEPLVALLRAGGARRLTVGVDGASQRLRDALFKGIRLSDIERCIDIARSHAMALKFYLMIGVPGELDEDLSDFATWLASAVRGTRSSLAVSPFVPKAHTPLEREGFAPAAELERRLGILRKLLGGKVELRATSVRWARVEAAIAGAPWSLAERAWRAHCAGGSFAAWRDEVLTWSEQQDPASRPWLES